MSFNQCADIALNLNCCVVSFEYPGYGECDYLKSTEKGIYNHIRQVYNYTVNDLKFSPNNIFLLGHSLGTGVSIDLASDSKFPIGGIILQAPLLSILRTIFEIKKSFSFDMFCSIDKLDKITKPAFIIHGSKDDVINLKDGKLVYEKLKHIKYTDIQIVKEGTHNMMLKNKIVNSFENIRNFITLVNGTEFNHRTKNKVKSTKKDDIVDIIEIINKRRKNEHVLEVKGDNDKLEENNQEANEESKIIMDQDIILNLENELNENNITSKIPTSKHKQSFQITHNENNTIKRKENDLIIEQYSSKSLTKNDIYGREVKRLSKAEENLIFNMENNNNIYFSTLELTPIVNKSNHINELLLLIDSLISFFININSDLSNVLKVYYEDLSELKSSIEVYGKRLEKKLNIYNSIKSEEHKNTLGKVLSEYETALDQYNEIVKELQVNTVLQEYLNNEDVNNLISLLNK